MKIDINIRLLNWAIEYSQKDRLQFDKKFPQLSQWLTQERQPTLKQLEAFANFAYIPLGYLFLDTPPQIEENPIADFRTLDGKQVVYSPNLLEVIETLKFRQDWLREYKIQESYDKLSFIGSIKRDTLQEQIITTLHQILDTRDDWRTNTEIKTTEDAFTYFRSLIEKIGVTVFLDGTVNGNTHRPLNINEFRGFVLIDDYAPIIFINNIDNSAARLFTLIHEFIHILLGEEGINDNTEAFCNNITAHFLVPKTLLTEKWRQHPDDFNQLSKIFKVSNYVLYISAYTYGLINKEKSEQLIKEHCKSILEKKNEEKKDPDKGGNYYRTAKSRLGYYAHFIIDAVKKGSLLYRDAYQLTGLSQKTFDGLIKEVK